MLEEHRSRTGAMRPLPPPERRRAAVASLAGHCAVLAVMAFVGVKATLPPAESPLIMAEFLTEQRAAVPATTVAELTTSPASTTESAPTEPTPPPPRVEQPVVAPRPAPLEEPVAPVEEAPERSAPPPAAASATEPPAAPLEQAAVEERQGVPPAEGPPLVTPPDPVLAPVAPGRAFAHHEQQTVQRRLSSWTGRLSPDEADNTLSWRADGQSYRAVLKPVPSADAMGMEQLAVELTTERDGERLVTELRMNRVAFSNFAQFIDRWDPEVAIHDDSIDGRFHSNSEIRVSRDGRVRPVFTGKVTLATGDIRTDGPGYLNRRSMFPGGIETSVRRIVLPPRAATFEPSVVPPDRLRRFERDSLITFNADGSFDAGALEGDAQLEHGTLDDEPFYLVADDDVELHVRGTVNGKVLVYSPRQIVIVDDVRYADDPREPGAGDYLGLVAERNVEIGEPEVVGAGDIEIHASIYARSRFLVRSYLSRRSGTLRIYGSVAAGSVGATEPRYATKIEFDDRLTTMRAPGFPMSDRYELDSTSNEWRVVGAAN